MGEKQQFPGARCSLPLNNFRLKHPTHLSEASSSGPRAMVLKLVVVKKLIIVEKLKNKMQVACNDKVPYENIGRPRRAFQGMINNVN